MSDRVQRFFLYAAALLLVAGTGVALRFASRYRPDTRPITNPESALPGGIGLRFQDVVVVGRSDGRRAWTLAAPQVDATRTRNQLSFAGGIAATLLQEEKDRATLTAPTATFDVAARRLTAAGSVEMRLLPTPQNRREVRLTTSLVSWDAGASVVRCPRDVTATSADAVIEANSLEANLTTRTLTLQAPHGRIPVDGNALP